MQANYRHIPLAYVGGFIGGCLEKGIRSKGKEKIICDLGEPILHGGKIQPQECAMLRLLMVYNFMAYNRLSHSLFQFIFTTTL